LIFTDDNAHRCYVAASGLPEVVKSRVYVGIFQQLFDKRHVVGPHRVCQLSSSTCFHGFSKATKNHGRQLAKNDVTTAAFYSSSYLDHLKSKQGKAKNSIKMDYKKI
jgi:hypothetical protein